MDTVILYLAALAVTFIVTALSAKKIIPILKSHKMGQKILDIGPRWHKSKEGTPTMGGIMFILGMVVALLGATVFCAVRGSVETLIPLYFTFALALCNGLIGVIDDAAKLRKKQNEGLTASQKFLLQLLAAGLYLAAMSASGNLSTVLYFPFFGADVNLGGFYYVFALILITGIVNSVNLADGIDGLAATETFVLGAFFTLVAFFGMAGNVSTALLGALICGGTLGFLVYNIYPARVFMGDTGSLFLGGLVVGGMFMIGNPLLVLLAGLVYVLETASVMLQVTYFKLTHGKRLFKMAPIHHHFEQCGWSEMKIVCVFGVLTALCCALSLTEILFA